MIPATGFRFVVAAGCVVVLWSMIWLDSVAREGVALSINETQAEGLSRGNELPCWSGERLIPNNARLLAAGAYAGRELAIQIDSSGHRATQIDVIINSVNAPVMLMLGAYEPTVWAVSWTQGTRLLGMLVSGNHRQIVVGLPDDIPVMETTLENGYPCGSFYIAEDNLHELNPVARQVFGRPVDMVYVANDGKVVVGDDLPPDSALSHTATVDLDALRLHGSSLAGSAGLAEAERVGSLRKATDADAQQWAEAYRLNRPKVDAPAVSGKTAKDSLNPTLHNAYVVLREFTYPAGLYGGNLATFYIPPGVPEPIGNPGHSTVFDMATGTCRGAMCKAL